MSVKNGKWIQPGTVEYNKLNISDGDFTIAKTSGLQTDLDAKIDESREGIASGIATLDGGGKIPAAQLPNSVMDYNGTWAASTNTPTLADGTGSAGDVFIASDAGSVDFGAGSIDFVAGDWVVYSGTIWEKSINSNAVASVNTKTGAVVLVTDDIDDSTSAAKYVTAADLVKLGFISVSQAVDLDTMESDIATLQGASHSHSNKALLDTYTQTEADLADAVTKKHAHANSAILDATTASFLVTDASKLDGIEALATADQSAAEVVFTPDGSIAATDVQAALVELDGDISAIVSNVNVTDEFTLIAGDISNGYVDLSQTPIAASISVTPDGGPEQRIAVDFTLSTNRLTFAGDLSSLLESGDILIVKYQY